MVKEGGPWAGQPGGQLVTGENNGPLMELVGMRTKGAVKSDQ